MTSIHAHLRLALDPTQGWSFTFDHDTISNWLHTACSGSVLEVMTDSFLKDLTEAYLS